MKDKENKRLKRKNKFIELFDENNDGKLDINDIILKCLRLLPGVKINREKFLRKVLKRKISQDKIDLLRSEDLQEVWKNSWKTIEEDIKMGKALF